MSLSKGLVYNIDINFKVRICVCVKFGLESIKN